MIVSNASIINRDDEFLIFSELIPGLSGVDIGIHQRSQCCSGRPLQRQRLG